MEATALHTIDARVRDFWPSVPDTTFVSQFLTDDLAERDPIEIDRVDFFDNRDKILRSLSARDITPIAVLPARLWDRLQVSANLLTLKMDGDLETVPLYPKAMAEQAAPPFERFDNMIAMLSITAAGAFAIGSGSLAHASLPALAFDDNAGKIAFSAILGAIFAFFGSIFALERIIPALRALLTTGAIGRMRALHLSRKALKQHTPLTAAVMMQDQSKMYGDRTSVRAILPIPPEDVTRVLDRARGLPGLSVAILEGAIAFEPSIETVLAQAILPGTTFADVYALEFDRDPIVFYQVGNAVGLIAQWGECPIEEDMVRRAVRLDTLQD